MSIKSADSKARPVKIRLCPRCARKLTVLETQEGKQRQWCYYCESNFLNKDIQGNSF